MKSLKRIAKLILLASFLSCGSPVSFNEPQPVDSKNLAEFPKRLHGEYLNSRDGSVILINNSLIVRVYNTKRKLHEEKSDSTIQIEGDSILNLNTNERELLSGEGDSIIINSSLIDTLFRFNSEHVVRKYKGAYFLNKLIAQEKWDVKKMELSKGTLYIGSIETKEEIESLATIAENNDDTLVNQSYSLTKKQFKEFMRTDGFGYRDTFYRIR